uniref:Melanocortin-2 receptor accessory protein n=1 Tax=Dromaius novaehollandiae TaxID=8790 RepID=A0A8C4JRA8_DRONO
MANRTNSSEYFWSYEYYWDYIDPIPVDGRKLKVNKYTIVIAFWVGLAAFVMFLFLILLYMSRSGSTPIKCFFLEQCKQLYQMRLAKNTVPTEVEHPLIEWQCTSNTVCDFELCLRTGFCLQLSTFSLLCLLLVSLANNFCANKNGFTHCFS